MEFIFGAIFLGVIAFAVWRVIEMNITTPSVSGKVTGTVVHVDKTEKSSDENWEDDGGNISHHNVSNVNSTSTTVGSSNTA